MLVLVLSVLSGDCLNAENRRENDLDIPETKEVGVEVEVEEEEEAEVEVGGGVEIVEGVGSVEVIATGVFLVPLLLPLALKILLSLSLPLLQIPLLRLLLLLLLLPLLLLPLLPLLPPLLLLSLGYPNHFHVYSQHLNNLRIRLTAPAPVLALVPGTRGLIQQSLSHRQSCRV